MTELEWIEPHSVTDIKQLLQPTYTIMEKLAAHRLIADLCNLEKKQLRGVALHTQDSTRWGNGLGGWCCLRRGRRGLSFLSFSLGFLEFLRRAAFLMRSKSRSPKSQKGSAKKMSKCAKVDLPLSYPLNSIIEV